MSALPAGTITRGSWGARPANHTPRRVSLLDRPGVEVHHSVGLYGARTAKAFAAAVQRDHLSRSNYADLWYALLVWTDGTPIEGRGVQYGSGSVPHLTVCLAGNYDVDEVPPAMAATVARVRLWLAERGGGDHLTWHGANRSSSCPGRHAIAAARAGAFDWPTSSKPAPNEGDDVTKDELRQVVREAVAAELAERFGDRDVDTDLEYLRRTARATAAAVGLETRNPVDPGPVLA